MPTFQYADPEDQILALLADRGPLLTRRILLGLLRHNHRVDTLVPLLEALSRKGLVRSYQRERQGAYRRRKQHVVELTELGQLEVALG
jgi:DNA-binding PadR family transcriptional regulator